MVALVRYLILLHSFPNSRHPASPSLDSQEQPVSSTRVNTRRVCSFAESTVTARPTLTAWRHVDLTTAALLL